jgi:hypothetical protein
MAYLQQDDENIIQDVLMRKEFYWAKKWPVEKNNKYSSIIPRFILEDAISRSGNLRLISYQRFIQNYMNPNTPYKRILMKWQTGTGKSIGALSIAMNFIQNYRLEKNIGHTEIGSVFIIGFSERIFKNELLRFPEFGFLSRTERHKLDKLKRLAAVGGRVDIDKYTDMVTNIKRRFSNRKGNGFFRFFGYKEFVNRILSHGVDINLQSMSEEQIRVAINQKKITYNEELLLQFKNSLVVCDEIHNVYNSIEKNNWGVAIQLVLDTVPTCRAVFASATPLNNSPAEIIDLLNLLLPSTDRLNRLDFFTSENELKTGALDKIAELSRGRISYLRDVNPKYYPTIKMHGETLKEIPYLKFIRCPMSSFHYNTYKEVYTGTLSQDSQYLVDFALENPDPDQKIGMFQTSVVKTGLANAPRNWKAKYGLDIRDGKIVGDALHRKNLGKYSAKYVRMLDELFKVIDETRGKVFIYHNIVHMSGVIFIEQVLIRNGFVNEFSGANDNTICMYCGKPRKKHSHREIHGGNEEQSWSDDEPNSLVEKKNGDIIWYYKNIEMMTANRKTSKKIGDYYKVNASSMDNALINGKSWALRGISSVITENIPLYIQMPNYAPRLGDWLLQIGFKIGMQTGRYTDMYLPVEKSGKVSGGKTKNRTKTKNQSTFRSKSVNDMASNKKSSKINSELNDKTRHKFTPARFIMAHSEIDKAQMEHSIEKFNNPDNADGNRFMILVGSKVMKESYDIKAIQNVFIMGKPDNIPTLLQIRGRAVRKNSHRDLPIDKREVGIYIFTSCLPVKQSTGLDKGRWELSYEEEKYKEKVAAFQVMQKIEKVLHENAIDSIINYDLINRPTEGEFDPLDAIPFKPNMASKYFVEQNINKINTATFNVYHAYKEVDAIRSMIKRLFIELSSVWEYNDLLDAVRTDPLNYETEINTRLFTEESFSIALDQLSWNNEQKYIEPLITTYIQTDHTTGGGEETDTLINMLGGEEVDTLITFGGGVTGGSTSYTGMHPQHAKHPGYIIDKLFNKTDKIITLPGEQDSIIMPIVDGKTQYYILFPIDLNTNEPNVDIETPYRITKQVLNNTINMNDFIQTKRVDFDYDDKKKIFYRKYLDISIENMENVVCEYGTTFHIKFLEECIEYVFRAWTDPKLLKHDYHEFYFKMLYYYDLLSLVMWAYTSKPRVFAMYNMYAIPVKAKDIKLKAMYKYEKRKENLADISPDDASDLTSDGIINLLKSSINHTSNVWAPREFRDQFNQTLADSYDLFNGKKKRKSYINKVSAILLPIGHYISKFPKIFHPEQGWSEDPTYIQHNREYVENPIIIGFNEKSKSGVHVRFKIRKPIHDIKKHKDSRLIHKGAVCRSSSKPYLRSISNKLDITIPDKVNSDELCMLIKSKLIRLELKERIKKSNIKYFYQHYEQASVFL